MGMKAYNWPAQSFPPCWIWSSTSFRSTRSRRWLRAIFCKYCLWFTTFLLAIATGGIPGGAAVTTGVLLHTMGMPVEAMGIILATDRILDAGCTVTNVVGDTAVGILCAQGESGAMETLPEKGQPFTQKA